MLMTAGSGIGAVAHPMVCGRHGKRRTGDPWCGDASPFSYLLNRLAGYASIGFYDGSIQGWPADEAASLISCTTE